MINSTIEKINRLPDYKIQEINDYVDFLLSKADDQLIREGVHKLATGSKTYKFLKDEEELYTLDDLKVKYK